MSDEFTLKNRVKELRERLQMRQVDLASEVGVTRQTVIAIEKGRLKPSVLLGLKIARVLREPVDYVFFLERRPLGQPRAPALARRTDREGSEPSAVWDFS
ncbi:MAG TPA: helix-turn-helix transcriptional regulator [Candidatus Hydrogenedentes bacterium]|nr:helix-turn-helix transcriptional regulator [Candidatus Hydrogenedentota bacterium]